MKGIIQVTAKPNYFFLSLLFIQVSGKYLSISASVPISVIVRKLSRMYDLQCENSKMERKNNIMQVKNFKRGSLYII